MGSFGLLAVLLALNKRISLYSAQDNYVKTTLQKNLLHSEFRF